jgi:hypothetical protein
MNVWSRGRTKKVFQIFSENYVFGYHLDCAQKLTKNVIESDCVHAKMAKKQTSVLVGPNRPLVNGEINGVCSLGSQLCVTKFSKRTLSLAD